MRALIRTTIIRDRSGYHLHDYGDPAPLRPGQSLLSGPPSGLHIVGTSGVNEMIRMTTAQDLRLWDKARRLSSPSDVADFMSRWGQITRWLGDEGDRPYEEPYILIEPHLKGLKYLGEYVDSGDKSGFARSLDKNMLLERAGVAIDINSDDLPLIIEAPSLLRFMIFEM